MTVEPDEGGDSLVDGVFYDKQCAVLQEPVYPSSVAARSCTAAALSPMQSTCHMAAVADPVATKSHMLFLLMNGALEPRHRPFVRVSVLPQRACG